VSRSPRPVIRGESPQGFLPVCIDYLNFSIPNGDHTAIVRECLAFLGASSADDRGRGVHGYSESVDIGGYAIVGFGGQHQRGTVFVSINGEGCKRIAHLERVCEWAVSLGARVTRVDIACDDLDGEHFTVASGIDAWRSGGFQMGGRPPSARLIDDFGSGAGKTLYVGSRAGGKMFRLYEKGRQLGDLASKWVRAELELHAKDRIIPWEAVINPLTYLAGSAPFFRSLSLVADRIRTFKRSAEASIKAVTAWVKNAAGRSLNALLRHFDGDYGAMVEAVRRDGMPRRLLHYEAGLGGAA
jgi:phage replication initiation protein